MRTIASRSPCDEDLCWLGCGKVRELPFFFYDWKLIRLSVVVLALLVRFMTVANELIPEEEQNEGQKKE